MNTIKNHAINAYRTSVNFVAESAMHDQDPLKYAVTRIRTETTATEKAALFMVYMFLYTSVSMMYPEQIQEASCHSPSSLLLECE